MTANFTYEQESMFRKNIRLVYYIVRKFNPPSIDLDDYQQVGMIGLYKAILTFNEEKKVRFATYATRVISNEILILIRKKKSSNNETSLDSPINIGSDDNEISLGDMLQDTSANFQNSCETNDELAYTINIILNLLTPFISIIMLLKLAGQNQQQIAEIFSLSQSYISRLITRSKRKIRQLYEEGKQIKGGPYMMDITSEYFKITFSTTDIPNFNRIFAQYLISNIDSENPTEFKVISVKNKVVLYLTKDPESLAFLAFLLKEIKDYSLEGSLQDESLSQVLCLEAKIQNDSESPNIPVKKIGFRKIYDYILTRQEFSRKELKEVFPDSAFAINNAINIALKDGVIEPGQTRGNYNVIKDQLPKK